MSQLDIKINQAYNALMKRHQGIKSDTVSDVLNEIDFPNCLCICQLANPIAPMPAIRSKIPPKTKAKRLQGLIRILSRPNQNLQKFIEQNP